MTHDTPPGMDLSLSRRRARKRPAWPLLWLLTLLVTAPLHAHVYSPRVLSPHHADAYSMRTFARFPRWRNLRGDALAWEVYRYLVDTRTGVFHMNEVLEGHDVMSEYRTVRDPVKLLNVYGYGYCGIFGPFMAGVCEGIGLGRARTLSLPAWNHVACETFYDDAWHYLDVDVRAVFRRANGSLASLEEARRDSSLWRERGPRFFPLDSLEATRAVYERTPVHHYHGFNSGGHTMDYVLRQGETFTRWWQPQGGRWQHAEVYGREPWLRKLIEAEPRGPKPNHREFTIHNHGNGRFIYRPNLSHRSTDFRDGVSTFQNVRSADAGLSLVRPGEGYAVFEVRSPYVIVPRVGQLDATTDDREASVVSLNASGASVAISLDNGLSWQKLPGSEPPHGSGQTVLDLTPHVSGTYGYLLKVTLTGRPGAAVLRSLSITTWVQVAPAALPALRRGANRMELVAGDHYGLPSRVIAIQPNGSEPAELLKYCVSPPEDYDAARQTSRMRGKFILRVKAPAGTRIAWFSAGGSFQTHQREAARNTRNAMAYATGTPANFHEFYRAEIPTDTDHWHYNADREVRLPAPTRELFLRYTGDPAVNNVRIYAHCVEDTARPPSTVAIRHAWWEDGTLKTRRFQLRAPATYTIDCEEEPVDELVELSVRSVIRS